MRFKKLISSPHSVQNIVYSNASALLVIVVLIVAACGGAPESSPTEQRDRIQQLIDAGDFEAALLHSRNFVRAEPDDAERIRFHGRVLLEAGRVGAAEAAFRRAESLGSSQDELLVDLGRALIMQRRYREALRLLPPFGEEPHSVMELLAIRGEAELNISTYNQEDVLKTFVRLYRALRDEPPASRATVRVKNWLNVTRLTHPVVNGAFQHFSCSDQPLMGDGVLQTQADAEASDNRILPVGPTRRLKTPSAAAREARDGDLIEIDAGVYKNDVATWTQNNLVLRGVGGLAHMQSNGVTADDKGIWVFEGNDNTVESIEFSGARSKQNNGSGIRLHGSGLTVRYSFFHDNENGILGGYGENSEVLIEYSEFARNGYGDGLSHNIHIGQIGTFTLRFSYSHHANVGHQVKSRARTNFIFYNRLMDEDTGNSSYIIDIPEGGRAFVVGNEIHKGRLSETGTVISFGSEMLDRSDQALFVVHNTFYNQYLRPVFVKNDTDAEAVVLNNLFAGGSGLLLDGPGSRDGVLAQGLLGLADPRGRDYSLTIESPAVDAGVEVPVFEKVKLEIGFEYVHPANGRRRQTIWKPDIGAHEFCGL